MTVNPSGWRPEMGEVGSQAPVTYTGNRGLMLEEPLNTPAESCEKTEFTLTATALPVMEPVKLKVPAETVVAPV